MPSPIITEPLLISMGGEIAGHCLHLQGKHGWAAEATVAAVTAEGADTATVAACMQSNGWTFGDENCLR